MSNSRQSQQIKLAFAPRQIIQLMYRCNKYSILDFDCCIKRNVGRMGLSFYYKVLLGLVIYKVTRTMKTISVSDSDSEIVKNEEI